MLKITKKSIFEDRLKGLPICVHTNETSERELQTLIEAKVLKIDRFSRGDGIARALCEIKSGVKVKNGHRGSSKINILYRYFIIPSGGLVKY